MNFKTKIYFIWLLALLAVAQNIFAAGETRFQAGVAAYAAGQFEPAAKAFTDSLAEKTAPGTLLNLGLADWRCDRTGEALLAWQQAAWLDPFDRAAAGRSLRRFGQGSVFDTGGEGRPKLAVLDLHRRRARAYDPDDLILQPR